jgi:hypothetical protein
VNRRRLSNLSLIRNSLDNHGAILPAQDRARSRRTAEHPDPFVGSQLLGRLLAQLLERRKHRSKDDFEQGRLLIAYLNVLLNSRQKTGERHFDRIHSWSQSSGGEATAIVGEKLARRKAQQILRRDRDGGAHLGRPFWVDHNSRNFPRVWRSRQRQRAQQKDPKSQA